MKKSLIYILPAAFLLGLSLSCTKQEITDAASDGEEQIITARVNIATKVLYSEVNETNRNAGLKSVWEKGDYFYAIQDDSKVVQFTITSDNYAGKTYAVFSTKTSGVTESTTWKAVLGEGASAKGTTISCEYMGQNGMLDGLGRFNYVIAESTGTEPSFDFDNGTKLSHILRIKLPEGVKCIEYTPCAYQNVTPSSSELKYITKKASDDTIGDYNSFTTITLSSASSSGDVIYIALPLANYSKAKETYNSNKQNGNLTCGVIITLLNNDSDNADASNGTVFDSDLTSDKGGFIETVDMSSMVLMKRAKPSEAIEFTKTGDIQCKLHSSALTQKASTVNTFWSPFNIGATKSSEIGNYYAWGEYTTKSNYTFDSYTNRHKTNGSTDTNDYMSYKFVIGSTAYGFTNANSRYDTARILWGSAWRTPHMIEVYAASNGQTSYATVDGKSGVNFTSGSSVIFIPNSRYMDGTSLNNGSSSVTGDNYDCARFWSADQLNRKASDAGWNEAFTFGTEKNSAEYDYWRRQHHLGFPIRPVLNSSVLN